jgi:hypothetical protein
MLEHKPKYDALIAYNGPDLLGSSRDQFERALRWVNRILGDTAKASKGVIFQTAEESPQFQSAQIQGRFHGHRGGGGGGHYHRHPHYRHHYPMARYYRPVPWWWARPAPFQVVIGDNFGSSNNKASNAAGRGDSNASAPALSSSIDLIITGEGRVPGNDLDRVRDPSLWPVFRREAGIESEADFVEYVAGAQAYFKSRFGLDFAAVEGMDMDPLTKEISNVAIMEPFVLASFPSLTVEPLAKPASASAPKVRVGGFIVTMINDAKLYGPPRSNGSPSPPILLKKGDAMLWGDIVIIDNSDKESEQEQGEPDYEPSPNVRIHFEGKTATHFPTNESHEDGSAAFQFRMDSHRLPDETAAAGEGTFIMTWGTANDAKQKNKSWCRMGVRIHMVFKRPLPNATQYPAAAM